MSKCKCENPDKSTDKTDGCASNAKECHGHEKGHCCSTKKGWLEAVSKCRSRSMTKGIRKKPSPKYQALISPHGGAPISNE